MVPSFWAILHIIRSAERMARVLTPGHRGALRRQLARPDRRSWRHAEFERDSLADPCEHDRAPSR